MIVLLDHSELQVVFAVCGVLVNLSSDPRHRISLVTSEALIKYALGFFVANSYLSIYISILLSLSLSLSLSFSLSLPYEKQFLVWMEMLVDCMLLFMVGVDR